MAVTNSLSISLRLGYREPLSENSAAKKIQAFWRGYQLTEQGMPDRICFQKAKEYTLKKRKLERLLTSNIGHAKVCFPSNLPVVIKRGRDLHGRMIKELFARSQCQRLSLLSLVVPSSELSGRCLIARKLLMLTDTKDQIALYVDNRNLFTNAVREFVKFSLASPLEYITGGKGHYQRLSRQLYDVHLGRYDNVALYLKRGRGNIGLIDVEHLKLPGPEVNDILGLTCNAITLFPYHFDEILSQIKIDHPPIEQHLTELERIRNKVLQAFKFLYEDHRDFVQAKQKTEKSPALEINFETQKAIKTRVENEIRNTIIHYPLLIGCFDEDAVLSLFMEQIFPDLLQITLKMINTVFAKHTALNITSAKAKGPNTPLSSIVTNRSFAFNSRDIKPTLTEIISLFSPLKLPPLLEEEFFDAFLSTLLKALKAEGEIYFYELRNSDWSHWIWC